MKIIAHRGANKEAHENTIDAFDLALEAGADRIECDLQLSKDGAIVIHHDDSLLSTCDLDKNISEMNRLEINSIQTRTGHSLPTLEEVLDRYGNKIELNLEIKSLDEKLPKILAVKLNERDWKQKLRPIIVSCFFPQPLVSIKKLLPSIDVAALWKQESEESAGKFGYRTFMDTCKTHIFHPKWDMVTTTMMEEARSKNWIIYPWMSMVGEDQDKESIWNALLKLGVDGLCTNYPREFKNFLSKRV